MSEQNQEQGAEELFAAGTEHLNAGRFEEALQAYDKLLAESAEAVASPELQNNRGLALFHLGRLDEAVEGFRTALSLMPDFAIAESNLGLALLNLKRFEEAIAPLQRSLQHDPALVEANYNLGLALYRTGRIAEALTAYEAFVANAPDTYHNYIDGVKAIIAQLKKEQIGQS
jgi:tetratricopeptide (TPR) repeat protein